MQNTPQARTGTDSREARLASLTRRLIDGETRIEAAQSRGEDVTAWEAFWLRLLHEYETAHDQLDRQLDHQSEEASTGIAA